MQIVVEVMKDKDFDGSRIHSSTMITGSRQNLSLQEQKDLANQIREVGDRKISDQEKSYALGFILLDFMGEEFLEAVAVNLPTVQHAAVNQPTFVAKSITDTGAGVVAPRNWGASLPVQRTKVVRELLTNVPLEQVRRRIISLLDSGQLGADEDERLLLRQQVAEILGRQMSDADMVFALGFAVHAVWDARRFQAAFADLTPVARPRMSTVGDEVDVDVTDEDDSGPDRPTTGEHPAISIKAGPLPVARD